jgi:hypothetical protein
MGRIMVMGVIVWMWSFAAAAQQASLKFIENKNQWAPGVDFAARVPGGRVFIAPSGFSLYLFETGKPDEHYDHVHGAVNEATGQVDTDQLLCGHHVSVTFNNALMPGKPVGSNRSDEYYNFFLGSDPERWGTGAYAYETITYPELYTGIDLRISSIGKDLKYDFIVSPDADPDQIQVNVGGADELYLSDGQLHIRTSVGELIEQHPYSYQIIGGVMCTVPSEFRLNGNALTFYFPEGYDPCFELVIDPLLIFSTFSGSTADNWGSTATPGENGTLYSSGITSHLNVGGTFPATLGAFQTNYGGNYDIAILKYDSIGSKMLYASYLGGSSNESPHSLVVDEGTGDLLVLGTTSSENFPISAAAFQKSYQGGFPQPTNAFDYPNGSDITVSRINMTGRTLRASTYLGGNGNDGLSPLGSPLVRNYGDDLRGDIITDEEGFIYISSVTSSTNFPAQSSFSTSYRGGLTDAIVVKLKADLSGLEWSAFLGGTSADAAHSIKLDRDNNIYLAGGTSSADFPVTTGSYQPVYNSGTDGWITKLNKDGSGIITSTFTGTTNYDQVYFVDLNEAGDVFVYGQTNGNFPVTAGTYRNANSGQFVQSLKGDLSALNFSTVFGSGIGIPNISPTAFMVSECDRLYMAGWGGAINISRGYWNSTTRNMPVTADALQKTTQGSDFYFIVLNGNASELLYATYLGGNSSTIHVDGGTSRFDRSGIVYHAVCAGCGGGFDDFPTTPGAWSRTNNSGNCNNAAFKFDLSSLRARLQTNSADFKSPGLNRVCYPDRIRFQNKSTGGKIFEWNLGDGTKITRQDTLSIVHAYEQPGTYRVSLKAIDFNTCRGEDSVVTFVQVFRTEMKAQDDDVICSGTAYQLKASGGVSYEWRTVRGALISTTVTPDRSTDYYVTMRDGNGCVKLDTVKLEVVPGIDLKFSYEYLSDCYSRPQVKLINETLQQSDETYVFDLGDGFTTDQQEVLHQYSSDGTYTVKLIGNKSFCVYEQPVVLPVYTLKVPNIITPEGTPGYNDVFTIQFGAKGQTPASADFTVGLKIYNRWGTVVFESDDYQYDWSANDVDSGVYYFTLTINEQTVCRSWVQVVK